MRDFIEIGPTPSEEDCQQCGTPEYAEGKAKEECQRFITLIRKVCGKEPQGACLRVKGNDHDFGRYYEVVCEYDEGLIESVQYAFHVEGNAPTKWDGSGGKKFEKELQGEAGAEKRAMDAVETVEENARRKVG